MFRRVRNVFQSSFGIEPERDEAVEKLPRDERVVRDEARVERFGRLRRKKSVLISVSVVSVSASGGDSKKGLEKTDNL